jgi:cystathionine beta-lyase/cystathionine gamma-synthase
MAKDSTRCVHEGEPFDAESGSVVTPIYETTTFAFTEAEEARKAVAGESDKFAYTRWGNPTTVRLEKKLASLEGAEDAAFFSSGMAAISTSAFAFLKAGNHAVATRDLYGGTFELMSKILPSFGVKTTLVDTEDQQAMKDAVKPNTKLVIIETPTNPTLKVVDIAKSARIAHSVGALLFVDNTFASPINQKPIELGADLVLHSATKYLNGHADVTAGAAAGDKEIVEKISHLRRGFGGTLDPLASWLVLRGMRTMALRVRAQNETAMALAEFLSRHKRVKAVHYPGLKEHPQHALAKRQMSGYGGMMSFEPTGSMKDAMRLTERLKVAFLAASLGGTFTLVSQPSLMTHTQLTPAERAKAGIAESLIRLSVGIEDKEDLIADFKQALDSL